MFSDPVKRINTGADLASFKRSKALLRIQETLFTTIEKIKLESVPGGILQPAIVTKGTTEELIHVELLPAEYHDTVSKFSSTVQGLMAVLDHLDRLITETPPAQGPRRFGNLECRKWHDKVTSSLDDTLKTHLYPFYKGDDASGFFSEAKYYLANAFGLKMRLDYGTGHELLFMAFVGALVRHHVIEWSLILAAEVVSIYARYFDVARRLILVYNLEPAGLHGVWGLDDHFHLMYILGAAEFVDNRSAPPVSLVLLLQVISRFRLTNLYVNAVGFIHTIKLGPFNEHLPIVYDIHNTVTLWSKVLQGLVRMYEAEVINKFPVVQHFWFGGELYPWTDQLGAALPFSEAVESSDTKTPPPLNIHTTRNNISMTGAPWARR